MTRIVRLLTALTAAVLTCGVAPVQAADIAVTLDSPFSFRATFSGVDTDAASVNGNDFQEWTFDYWSVLVNLRLDSIDANGVATGFYEIQLRHTGHLLTNSDAPIVNTFLMPFTVQPGEPLDDLSVSSLPHGTGSDYLSTTVKVLFQGNTGTFTGSIAGDADFDGNLDTSNPTDEVVKKLTGLKAVGVITGKEMGQIIKQTRRPRD